MKRHNISALVMAITLLVVVLSIISGFTIYFNNSDLNQAWSVQQQQQIEDKDMIVLGVHSPEFTFEKNHTNVKAAVQRFGMMMTYPAKAATMTENHTIDTIKINKTQLQQVSKSQFKKAPEFAQISGYIYFNSIPLLSDRCRDDVTISRLFNRNQPLLQKNRMDGNIYCHMF